MNDTLEVRRVAVSGASGFLGSALVRLLANQGIEVHALVRRTARGREIEWSPERGEIDSARLEGLDAVVHLAGESIAGLWTPAKKKRIMESREQGTSLIAQSIAKLSRPPRTLVSASGVGYYGAEAGDTMLTESSPPGDDFLARVCVAWEAATQPAVDAGIRVAQTRFGLIIHPDGGVLHTMLPAFKLGLGAKLGDGQQWMSWISLEDCVRVIDFVLRTSAAMGPINTASPEPVRNEDFTRIVAESVRRPAFLAAPAFALRAVTGGMADALLLGSQRVQPARLAELGFRFNRPLLSDAVVAGQA